ncbi:MAG TPA: hypothetical protein EYQ50_07990 [Verrucomicrobiales bacterium]|nr:hypothetical protein [Verrucomicrobiales bacterium]HIL69757.1 hypothetical protein [Verrucomicrobiota bacterium]
MKTNIDIKSAFIEALLTVVVIFGVAAATDKDDQIGRDQIALTDRYIVILDSATGEMWRRYPTSPQIKQINERP